MKRYPRLGLLAMTAILFAVMACKAQEPSVATAVSAAVAAPAALTPAQPRPTRIIFVGKERVCDCTRKSIEAGWDALQKALGAPAKLPVERLQIDTQGDKVAPYRQQKPMMALPAIYFVDDKGAVIELLQGEITAKQVTDIVK